jgi:hypothetical protein
MKNKESICFEAKLEGDCYKAHPIRKRCQKKTALVILLIIMVSLVWISNFLALGQALKIIMS